VHEKQRRWGVRALVAAAILGAVLLPASPAHAAGTLSVDQDLIEFGPQRVGTFGGVERVTVTASGGSVTIEDVVIDDSTTILDFLLVFDPDDGAANYCYDTDDTDDTDGTDPVTVADGDTCVVDILFSPGDRDDRHAVLSFESTDATNDETVQLNGTGTVGYFTASAAGEVVGFGDAEHQGDMFEQSLNAPIFSIATTGTGDGYWLVGLDGGIFTFGDAEFYGSMGATPLNAPVVDLAATPSGEGYWLVAEDGGVFAFGDAQFYGSMGGTQLNQPVVGITATQTGEGYWLVAQDGGIFAFGDAQFFGSMGGTRLNQPVVRIESTPTDAGYWMMAFDGGIFAFGDADFYGSMGGVELVAPTSGFAAYPTGNGYWMTAFDGGIFSFGDAPFLGRPEPEEGDLVVAMTGTAPVPLAAFFGLTAADAGDRPVRVSSLPAHRRR
jgi:hypothetical protein